MGEEIKTGLEKEEKELNEKEEEKKEKEKSLGTIG